MTTTPVVGMGATRSFGSDCYPYTIVDVLRNGRAILVTADSHKLIAGTEMDGSAQYEYTSNPDQEPREYTLRKNGQYCLKGASDAYIYVGSRRYYRDPHF